jgi:membrane fusion protein (multidrug efflux system)
MIKKYLLGFVISTLTIVMFSCNNKEQKVQKIQEIPTIKVLQHNVPVFSEYVGNMYGKKDIPIRARVEGFLESIDFKEGTKVKKGQLLYTIDPQSLIAATNAQKSQVTAAQTELSKAKSDLERIKPLAASKAVSESELDAAQAAYDAAVANLNATRANLKSSNIDLSYTKVLSPIDGVIGKTNANVGEFVGREPNPVILNTVSETDSVKVKFFVTESEYIKFAKRHIKKEKNSEKKTQKSIVKLQLADGEIYEYDGKIDFIDRNIDETTGSIMVQASFPNPDRLLRPGLYSKIKIQTDIIKDAIIIPQRCLMELQGQMSVLVVTDSNKVVSRPVKVGYKAGDLAAISEGLEVGDRIVIDALQKVRNGMIINPVDTVFESKVFPKIKFKK